MTDELAHQIVEIAVAARAIEAPDIDIAGNTDSAGTDSYNEDLSRRRAEIVRVRLIAAGVATESIHATWYAASNPRVPTPPDGHQPLNRRDEVTIR
ncbi:MAG: OmpA family protein [Rhodospirillales bacterium]|nr:OmpA family protein [Rhodospirillales bacterium]